LEAVDSVLLFTDSSFLVNGMGDVDSWNMTHETSTAPNFVVMHGSMQRLRPKPTHARELEGFSAMLGVGGRDSL
jgi:hypothetical protein